MRYRQLVDGPERTWVAVFRAGDDAVAGLDRLARDLGLDAARFTAVGGFERAVVGYFVVDEGRYERVPIEEQVEVVSLLGDVALGDDGPVVHAHVVVADRTATARGGHLLEAVVRPTLEVMVTESPAHLRRRFDPRFGIALIDPDPA